MKPLIDHLPEFYEASPEMTAIQSALSKIVSKLWENRDSLTAQLDPTTASWGLSQWESALGISPPSDATIESRRASVIIKLRSKATVTLAMIENMASVIFGGPMEVTEIPGTYILNIKSLKTYGVPENIDLLTAQFNAVLPAHIAWKYDIRHYTWGQVEEMYPTWGDIEESTWEDLKANDV